MTEARSGADIFGRLRRGVLVETGEVYFEDRALRLGAGLGYYGVVTMAPILPSEPFPSLRPDTR